tara:strand:- start:6 stop:356 length:351 start_codon:yes stop_codon:yes gene_type:complete
MMTPAKKQEIAKTIMAQALQAVRTLGLKPELDFTCDLDHVSEPTEDDFVFYPVESDSDTDAEAELALTLTQQRGGYFSQFNKAAFDGADEYCCPIKTFQLHKRITKTVYPAFSCGA